MTTTTTCPPGVEHDAALLQPAQVTGDACVLAGTPAADAACERTFNSRADRIQYGTLNIRDDTGFKQSAYACRPCAFANSAYINDMRIAVRGGYRIVEAGRYTDEIHWGTLIDGNGFNVVLPDLTADHSDGDWVIKAVPYGYTAENTLTGSYITDPGDRYHTRRHLFRTVDEGLSYFLGGPVPVDAITP